MFKKIGPCTYKVFSLNSYRVRKKSVNTTVQRRKILASRSLTVPSRAARDAIRASCLQIIVNSRVSWSKIGEPISRAFRPRPSVTIDAFLLVVLLFFLHLHRCLHKIVFVNFTFFSNLCYENLAKLYKL